MMVEFLNIENIANDEIKCKIKFDILIETKKWNKL